jgi:hypothetical protein
MASRRANFTACTIFSVDECPPHGGTFSLVDVDGDGRNELLIGSTSGCISVFKTCDDEKPWAQGSLDLSGDHLALLVVGRFRRGVVQPSIAAVTVGGHVILLQIREKLEGGHVLERVSGYSSSCPLNATAGFAALQNQRAATTLAASVGDEVLILGTSNAEVCILSFNSSDGGATVETIVEVRLPGGAGVSSLCQTEESRLVICGRADGSVTCLSWPSLDVRAVCIDLVPPKARAAMGPDKFINAACCIETSGECVGVVTRLGDFVLLDTKNLVPTLPGGEKYSHCDSIDVGIACDEPFVAISMLSGMTSEACKELIVTCSANGKTLLVDACENNACCEFNGFHSVS